MCQVRANIRGANELLPRHGRNVSLTGLYLHCAAPGLPRDPATGSALDLGDTGGSAATRSPILNATARRRVQIPVQTQSLFLIPLEVIQPSSAQLISHALDMVNMKLALFAVLAVAATLVAADDEPANNGTTGGGNGTIIDDGTGGNGTSTNGTATNGTATNGTTNGTATNTTDPPESSGGSTRRSLAMCEYDCPSINRVAQLLDLRTDGGDTFTCTYPSGPCTYQTESGVLSSGDADSCRGAAWSTVAGCIAGNSNNGGVEKPKLKRGSRRSSREIQFEALAKRLGF